MTIIIDFKTKFQIIYKKLHIKIKYLNHKLNIIFNKKLNKDSKQYKIQEIDPKYYYIIGRSLQNNNLLL